MKEEKKRGNQNPRFYYIVRTLLSDQSILKTLFIPIYSQLNARKCHQQMSYIFFPNTSS